MPSTITAKWEAATPFRKHDNLIASEQFRHLKTFKPTYESDNHVYMNWIMAGEYGRLWLEEQKKWEKMNYGADNRSLKKECIRRKRVMIMRRK